jgi:hypothetical protein
LWTHIATWFLGLGETYGVDPIIDEPAPFAIP